MKPQDPIIGTYNLSNKNKKNKNSPICCGMEDTAIGCLNSPSNFYKNRSKIILKCTLHNYAKQTVIFDETSHRSNVWQYGTILNKQNPIIGIVNLPGNLKSHSHPFLADSPIPGHPQAPH